MRGRGMIAATHFFRRQAPLDRRSMRARVTPIRLAQNPRTSRLQAQWGAAGSHFRQAFYAGLDVLWFMV